MSSRLNQTIDGISVRGWFRIRRSLVHGNRISRIPMTRGLGFGTDRFATNLDAEQRTIYGSEFSRFFPK